MNNLFDLPVVLIVFKRIEKTLLIIEVLKKIKPSKLYILSDGGRNDDEWSLVNECRTKIEDSITWDCNVVKRYADKNLGVYLNIAEGARWVFQREEFAIFLEDDNLPEESFFFFCREIFTKYRDDSRVFWICGTNYLVDYQNNDGASYFFTQNMMPCGWASWSHKFLHFYDFDFELYKNKYVRDNVWNSYSNLKLRDQDFYNFNYEIEFFNKNGRFYSWDYHMAFSIRANNLVGIVPKFNQIKNIGFDVYSTHGGYTLDNIMTSRFCNINTIPLDFPLKHPVSITIDNLFEKKVADVILDPSFHSVKSRISRFIRKKLRLGYTSSIYESLISKLKSKFYVGS